MIAYTVLQLLSHVQLFATPWTDCSMPGFSVHQCPLEFAHTKEIEENNRMGKTRDLFKKIRDTKGTFHAKMGSIKDRNGMDLTEVSSRKLEIPREHFMQRWAR